MWPYWQGKCIGRFSREEASEAAWFQTFLSQLMRRCLPTDFWPETEGTIATILYSCLFGTPVAPVHSRVVGKRAELRNP